MDLCSLRCFLLPCWNSDQAGFLSSFYVFKAGHQFEAELAAVLRHQHRDWRVLLSPRDRGVYMRNKRGDVLRKLPPTSPDGSMVVACGADDALSGPLPKSFAWNCAFAKPYPVGALVDRLFFCRGRALRRHAHNHSRKIPLLFP